MVAYSGGAADTTNDRYFLWTSGHNDYQGNEMYELDLKGSTPTVSRITIQSGQSLIRMCLPTALAEGLSTAVRGCGTTARTI